MTADALISQYLEKRGELAAAFAEPPWKSTRGRHIERVSPELSSIESKLDAADLDEELLTDLLAGRLSRGEANNVFRGTRLVIQGSVLSEGRWLARVTRAHVLGASNSGCVEPSRRVWPSSLDEQLPGAGPSIGERHLAPRRAHLTTMLPALTR